MFILSLTLSLGALAVLTAGDSRVWTPYVGAIQRLLLTFTYAWVIAVAVSLGAIGYGTSAFQRLPPGRR
jgi:hypothetical protein